MKRVLALVMIVGLIAAATAPSLETRVKALEAKVAALTARTTALEASMSNVILSITKLTPPQTPPPPSPPPPTPPPPVSPPLPPPVEPTPGTRIVVPVGGKGVTITANNQVVENLVIEGPGFTTYDGRTYGIYASGSCNGVIIRHVTIRKMGHSGIWLAGCSNVLIEDSTIEDVAYAGIYLVGVTGGIVRRNAIHRVGNDGLSAGVGNNAYGIAVGGTTTRSSDVLVEHNEVTDVPMWHGLDTHGGLRITFHGNTVRRTPRAIFLTTLGANKATDCVISGNLFTEPVEVTGGTDPGWATAYNTVGCSFTGNTVGSAYGAPNVYDYLGLSTGLTQSGNVNGETLP